MTKQDENWQARAARVLGAGSEAEVRTGYDAWAPRYDEDHSHFGLPLLTHFVGMFCRHVSPDSAPILDAGAGTGRLGEVLSLHGFDSFVGIDLSRGMLEVAAKKPAYRETRVQRLGDPLDFDDDTFPVVASLGAFAPNLASADGFDELIRITRPGGILVLSMRAGLERITGFDQRRNAIESEEIWQRVDGIDEFVSHPEIDPSMRYGIHVYRKF